MITVLIALFSVLLFHLSTPHAALSGTYTESAHGDSSAGVNRSELGAKGYLTGNCAHCHEQHGSIEGEEPQPSGSAPEPFALLANNFSDITTGNYAQSDDACFYCHTSTDTLQSDNGFTNLQYSQTFGGSLSSGAESIQDAFNLTSYHNLYDIQTFASSEFTYFKNCSNPCIACHNPHQAKRNKQEPKNPAISVLSRPTDHENLWAQSLEETFNTFYQEYEPPYCTSTANREPASSTSAAEGAQNTPDYVIFCTDCHNSTNLIYSTVMGRNLHPIDWSADGDKHGMRNRDVAEWVLYKPLFVKHPERPPYVVTFSNDGAGYMAVSSHNVLSCMDCHEAHGSANVALIRSRVNGEELTGNIISSEVYNPSNNINAHDKTMGYLCQKCHKDDLQMAGGAANEWRWVHHKTLEAPYPSPGQCGTCGTCHGAGTSNAISCSYCHFHGSDDSWMDTTGTCSSFTTGRRTF